MTYLYVKAALVVAISLLVFILVTKAAWPANMAIFRAFAAWCRSLPDKWKRRRDPAYRRRMELVERYDAVFGGLLVLVAQRASFERKRAESQGEFGVRLFGAYVDEADAKIEGMRLVAVAFMRDLDDDAVSAIADHLNAATFDGKASAGELRAFLSEERGLIVDTPHHAAGHAQRLIRRFAHLAPAADASAPA